MQRKKRNCETFMFVDDKECAYTRDETFRNVIVSESEGMESVFWLTQKHTFRRLLFLCSFYVDFNYEFVKANNYIVTRLWCEKKRCEMAKLKPANVIICGI